MAALNEEREITRRFKQPCYIAGRPAESSQVKIYSPGEHEGSAQRKPQGPARWGGLWVVGMHAAAPAALWAARDEFTCAGAALLEAFLSELQFLPLSCCAFAHSTVPSVLGALLSAHITRIEQ